MSQNEYPSKDRTHNERDGSRRRFLGQAAVAGAAAMGLFSLTPSRAAAAPAVPHPGELPGDGPWVLVKSNRVRQLLAQARALPVSHPRKGDAERVLALEEVRLLDGWTGPLMTVHYELFSFLDRLA